MNRQKYSPKKKHKTKNEISRGTQNPNPDPDSNSNSNPYPYPKPRAKVAPRLRRPEEIEYKTPPPVKNRATARQKPGAKETAAQPEECRRLPKNFNNNARYFVNQIKKDTERE